MRYYKQYISSSDSEADEGGSAQNAPEQPTGNAQVGFGQPWIDPFPNMQLVETSPCVIVWQENNEERQFGADAWNYPGVDIPQPDDPYVKGVPISLYERFDGTNSKMIMGVRVGNRRQNYDREKHRVSQPGNNGGVPLRFPYYWDGVSPFIAPELDMEVFNSTGATAGVVYSVRVIPDGDSFNASRQVGWGITTAATRFSASMSLGTTQCSTFVKGWNEFKMRVIYAGTGPNGQSQPWHVVNTANLGGFTHPGATWYIHGLRTSLPFGCSFELKSQRNWLSRWPTAVVKRNGTNTISPLLGTAAQSHTGGYGSSNILVGGNTGIIMDTTVKWDVYSRTPSTPDNWWWRFFIKQDFQINYESNCPIFMVPSSEIGVDGGTWPPFQPPTYLFTNDTPLPLVDDIPSNTNRWVGKNDYNRISSQADSDQNMAFTWLTQNTLNLDNDEPNKHVYVPYNCRALIYLKQGGESSDNSLNI